MLLLLLIGFAPIDARSQTVSQATDYLLNWKSSYPILVSWTSYKSGLTSDVLRLSAAGANDLLEMNLNCIHKKKYNNAGEYVGNPDCDLSMTRFKIKHCSSRTSEVSDLCVILVNLMTLNYLEASSPLDSKAVGTARGEMSRTVREIQYFIQEQLMERYKRVN